MGHSTNVLILRAGINFKWNIYYIATHYVDYFANFCFYYRCIIVYVYYLFRFKYLNFLFLRGIMLGMVRLNVGYNENFFKLSIYLYDKNYFKFKFFFYNVHFLRAIIYKKKQRMYSTVFKKKSYRKLFSKYFFRTRLGYISYKKMRNSRKFFKFFLKRNFKLSNFFFLKYPNFDGIKTRIIYKKFLPKKKFLNKKFLFKKFLNKKKKKYLFKKMIYIFSKKWILNRLFKQFKFFIGKKKKFNQHYFFKIFKKELNINNSFLLVFSRFKYLYYINLLLKFYVFFKKYFRKNFYIVILCLYIFSKRKNFYMRECKQLFFKLVKYKKVDFFNSIVYFLKNKYKNKKKNIYNIFLNLVRFNYIIYIYYLYFLVKSYFLFINIRYIYMKLKNYFVRINLMKKRKSLYYFSLNYIKSKFFLFFFENLFSFLKNGFFRINYKFLFFCFYIVYRITFLRYIFKKLINRIKKKSKLYKNKILNKYIYIKFYLIVLVFFKIVQNNKLKLKKLIFLLYRKLFIWYYYYFVIKYIRKLYMMIFYRYLQVFLLNKLYLLLKNNKLFLNSININFIPLNYETISSKLILLLFRWKFNRRFTMNQIIWPFIRVLSNYKNIIKGFFIKAAGRFTSRQRASLFKYGYGQINFSTFKIYLIYDAINIVSRYGTGGVKMWITLKIRKYRKFNSFYLIKNV